jgi:hypothetical protein
MLAPHASGRARRAKTDLAASRWIKWHPILTTKHPLPLCGFAMGRSCWRMVRTMPCCQGEAAAAGGGSVACARRPSSLKTAPLKPPRTILNHSQPLSKQPKQSFALSSSAQTINSNHTALQYSLQSTVPAVICALARPQASRIRPSHSSEEIVLPSFIPIKTTMDQDGADRQAPTLAKVASETPKQGPKRLQLR